MRILLLKDTIIPAQKVLDWQREFTSFITPLLDLTPEVTVETYDFKNYPTELDTDGTLRPGDAWLKELGGSISRKHGLAFDHVILLIHIDNWASDDGTRRIWGTNYSYVYGPFHLHYCRYDKRNQANTFGTIHHELHHSYDARVKVETGVDVNPLLGVTRYDAEVTHGGKNPPWTYMRWKDNGESIKIMAPHMRRAYAVRKARHDDQIRGMQLTIIGLAKKVIYLLRQKLHAKNGIQL